MKFQLKIVALVCSVALLGACGGGGDGGAPSSGPETSALSFDLGAGLRQLTVSGQQSNFSVSANNGCLGSGSYTTGPANTATTFENQSAFSSTTVSNINYTNCTPATISSTSTTYVDTNYLPLGASGDTYLVYGTLIVPSSVKVADVGIIGSGIRYTDNTKTTPDGSVQLSYVVEADTATSAIVTVATKAFTQANALDVTQLTKYRINSSNALSLVSLTVQYANGTNVVFTRN